MKFYLLLFTLFLFQLCLSQEPFKIDKNGEVVGGRLSSIVKQRGYQAVSAFDTVSKKPILIYAQYLKNGKFGIIDNTGKEITAAIYGRIVGLDRSINSNLFAYPENFIVEENGRYGLISNKGKVLLPVKYEQMYLRSRDSLYEVTENGEERIINKTGKTITIKEKQEETSEYIPDYNNELSKDQKEYLITDNRKNKKFKIPNLGTIQQQYGNAIIFKNAQGKFGLYHIGFSKVVVPFEYDDIKYGHKGTYIVMKQYRYGLIDSLSQQKLPVEYETLGVIMSGFYGYKQKEYSLFDKDGNTMNITFDGYAYLGNKGLILKKNGKYGILSPKGELVTPFNYDSMYVPEDHDLPFTIIIATKNNKITVFDFNGKIYTENKYDEIVPESLVFSDSRTLEPVFNGYANQPNRFYFVREGEFYGLVDNNFKPLIDTKYDYFLKSSDRKVLFAKKNQKWGMINLIDEKVIIPFEYDNPIIYKKGNYQVQKNKDYGLVNRDGRFLIPLGSKIPFETEKIYIGLWKIYNYSDKSYYYLDYSGRKTEPIVRKK